MLRKLLATPALALAIFLPGCIVHQQALYVSPFNGNSNSYHTLPMMQDSARTAVYAQTDWFAGNANDNATDGTWGANTSVYIAQHRGMLQWYYGLNATLGAYNNGRFDTGYAGLIFGRITVPPATAAQLDQYSGQRTFGGAGVSGGINGVIPMGQGEWRFLGIETSLHREFGDYLHFRRKLPDSLATYIVRQPFFGTIGLNTELVFRTRQGNFGFRFAGGWALGAAYHPNLPNLYYDSSYNTRTQYGYGSFSFQYTWHQWTLSWAAETAHKGSSYRFGAILRLNKPRLPAKHIYTREELLEHFRGRPLPPGLRRLLDRSGP